MLPYRRHKGLGPRPRSLNVLGPNFQHILCRRLALGFPGRQTTRLTLKLALTSPSFPCRSKRMFLLFSPSWSGFGCRRLERAWRLRICSFREERSCLMMKVNCVESVTRAIWHDVSVPAHLRHHPRRTSLISTGLSSNSVFFLATVPG